jgi:hypothetical protein
LECTGAPRDLGLDQGLSRAREIAAALRGRRAGALTRLVWRDVTRHLPHAAERMQGLARGAGVGTRALTIALEDELALRGHSYASGGLALGVGAERSGSGPLLIRGLGTRAAQSAILRRSLPDHGFRSLEVGLPWLVGGLAGVNEVGLAATGISSPASEVGPVAAPALLLLQECLQQFDSAEKAADWCLRRPGGGRSSLLFVDAEGRQLGVFADGPRRRVLHADAGLLLPHDASPEAAALEKACRDAPVLDGAALQRIRAGEPEGLVWLDPVGRRLGRLTGTTAAADPDGIRWLETANPEGAPRSQEPCS